MEIVYQSVEPLIGHVEQAGDELVCQFVCPLTGISHEGRARLVKGRGLGDVSTVEGSLFGVLRRSLGLVILRALGPKKSARARAGEAALAAGTSDDYTESERQAAALLAFRSIANRFVWHGKAGRWVAAEGAGELLTPFARQLEVAPVVEAADQAVLSRMLVEVARADGKVTPTEWAFLGDFIRGDMSSVDTCMEQPDLTADELDGVSRGASRDTMLMLAWALALTDEDMDPDETGRLLAYAKGLRIPEARAFELRAYALGYLLEDAFGRAYPSGKPKKRLLADAFALAQRLAMTAAEAAEAEARFKHRHGLE